MIKNRKQDGFTLVELILATAFFSFIMLFVVVGFVQVNRSYTRGLTVREVQNSAREVIDIIAGEIRDSEAQAITPPSALPARQRLCTGSSRIAWNMPNELLPSEPFSEEVYDADSGGTEVFTLVRTTDGAPCNNEIEQSSGTAGLTEELLDEGLVVQYLNIERIGSSASYRITLIISTDAIANDTDFSQRGQDAACEIQTGDQFCDVAKIETVVTARN